MVIHHRLTKRNGSFYSTKRFVPMDIAMTTITAYGSAPAEKTISSWMTFLLAAACGLIVANIY